MTAPALEVHEDGVDLVLPAEQLDAFEDVVFAWLDELLADPAEAEAA